MTDQPVRRRGRPPVNTQVTDNQTPPATEKAPSRRRRASVDGMSLKLKAPTRPGFVRRWFNDDGNRIAAAEEMAYDFVNDQGIKSDGQGSRISRLVGTKANGEPLSAFLMETPVDEYAVGVSDREAINRKVDEAITTGRDFTGRMNPEETYGQGSIQRDR